MANVTKGSLFDILGAAHTGRRPTLAVDADGKLADAMNRLFEDVSKQQARGKQFREKGVHILHIGDPNYEKVSCLADALHDDLYGEPINVALQALSKSIARGLIQWYGTDGDACKALGATVIDLIYGEIHNELAAIEAATLEAATPEQAPEVNETPAVPTWGEPQD